MSLPQLSRPVYLLDASIYIFQAHFSPYIECFDRQGGDLSAVYGFTQFLLQFLRRAQPRYAAVAHDESLFCGFRHSLCPNYKSNRELPDDNLAMQLQACATLCEIFGLAAFGSKVYEADDIIGTLSRRVRVHEQSQPGTASSCQLHIVSKDKDLAQLLKAEEDCLWEFSSNQRRFRASIIEEYGVSPEQIPDYLGLTGDAVDCISGVPGVGAVKARELLQNFRDMDEIYDNLHTVAQLKLRGAKRLADQLEAHRDLAELSRTLATIVCEVDDQAEEFGRVELADLEVGVLDVDEFRSFLVEYGFVSDVSERLVSQALRLAES